MQPLFPPSSAPARSAEAFPPEGAAAAAAAAAATPADPPRRWVRVRVATQQMELWEEAAPDGDGGSGGGDGGSGSGEGATARLRGCLPVSTSRFGLGSEPGSFRTPLGRFRVGEKIGAGAAPGTAFRHRRPDPALDPATALASAEADLILSRILWLEGVEAHNANTRERMIYIHGTNHEGLLGQAASHGCVRMRNADVITLFDWLPAGAAVEIVET